MEDSGGRSYEVSQPHGLWRCWRSGAWAEEQRQTAVTGVGGLDLDRYFGPPISMESRRGIWRSMPSSHWKEPWDLCVANGQDGGLEMRSSGP